MEKGQKISVPLLLQQNAQYEADIRTVITVVGDLFGALGIDASMFSGSDQGSLKMLLPTVLKDLSIKMMTGNFDNQALENAMALAPIIERYKHLTHPANGH